MLLFPSVFCEQICYFISHNTGVFWYSLKDNTGRLSEGVDALRASCDCHASGQLNMCPDGLGSFCGVCFLIVEMNDEFTFFLFSDLGVFVVYVS